MAKSYGVPQVARVGAVTLGALALVSTSAAGQTVDQIVDRMISTYEQSVAGVDNYTIVQTTMGFETVTYFEKEMVEGHPVFLMRQAAAGGVTMNESPVGGMELYRMGEDFKRVARYAGTDRVNDFNVHVLEIDDLSDLDFAESMSPGDDAEFTPQRGRIFIDTDAHMPRRMEFEGELTNEQGVHSVTSIMDLLDYREVEGMLHPFRTVMTIEGLGAAIDPEMRAQFEEMQRELENMPEQQRRMVEAMFAERFEQFQSMMEGGDEPMSFEFTVREIRVNQGPPGA